MSTAEQIRANATASLGAASSSAVASGANVVLPAPTGASAVPQVAVTDELQAAPKTALTAEEQIAQLQAQLAQALGVIATIRPAAVAAVQGERTYHSSSPFVKIQVMRAPGIVDAFQFKGGKLTTDDAGAIAFVEAAIAAGNSGFSHAPIPDKPTAEEIEMRADVRQAAIIARDKMVKAGEAVA